MIRRCESTHVYEMSWARQNNEADGLRRIAHLHTIEESSVR